jgi:hypothetical protein
MAPTRGLIFDYLAVPLAIASWSDNAVIQRAVWLYWIMEF